MLYDFPKSNGKSEKHGLYLKILIEFEDVP